MNYTQTKSKKKVVNVLNMTQYCIHGNYITLFGEIHTRVPLLYDPSTGIRLDEFILDRVQKNPNTRVLLEYHTTFNPMTIGSININQIYTTLASNNMVDKIIPFDFKYYFLDIRNYFKLYDISEFSKLSTQEIKDNYLEPFFDKGKHDAFLLDRSKYSPGAYAYLFEYLKNVENRLGYLFTDIILPVSNKVYKTPAALAAELSSDWTDLADFFTLREVLKNQRMEYVIVVGDKHRQNIQKVFNNFTRLLETTGEIDGLYCVTRPRRRRSKRFRSVTRRRRQK